MKPAHTPGISLFVLAAVMLAGLAPAQVVRVANHTALPFHGWKRTTIDVLPQHVAGVLGDVLYVVGRRTGVDVHVVDLRVSLAAGEQRTFDLAQAAPAAWTRAPFPAEAAAWFGGPVTIGGQVVPWQAPVPDGAGYSLHLRTRLLPMLAVDLWATWYPDQPGFCHGEVALCASNPAVPDLEVHAPANLALHFGNALVLPVGGAPWQLVGSSGLQLMDGQARVLPLTFVWLQHLAVADVPSVLASAELGIGAVGVRSLLADGKPSYPAGFSARAWATERMPEAVRRLHTMEPPVCGPARTSAVTGAQEDQVFVRGEALLPDGVGAEWVAYLSALKLAARPCHHLEGDGRPLDVAAHQQPRLVFWDGRVHWSPILSPDRLGKTGSPTLDETKLWWGPDVEHWLMNTLAAATRLTGSPACQWLLAHQATIYRLQATTEPGLSTTSPFAARAVGWEGILAVHLWRELEDRALAAIVRSHWQARVTDVILPAYGDRPNAIWDARFDDPRLGKGWWYQPWQQAIGAYGLDLGCAVLGPAAGRAVARAAAAAVLRDAFVAVDGTWRCRAAVALDGRVNEDPSFWLFGSPLAPAVVLRHAPTDETARAIWQQMRADALLPSHCSWLPPGIAP